MTPEQLNSMEQAVTEFTTKARAKYQSGQAEHGGNLWERKNLLADIGEETIDLMFYQGAICQKVDGIVKFVRALRHNVERSPISDIQSFKPLILQDLAKMEELLTTL